MSIKEHAEKRVAELQASIEQIAAQYNMVIGHLHEAQAFLVHILEPAEAEVAEDAEEKEVEGMEHAP